MSNKDHNSEPHAEHISSYREHFGTWVGLILLTMMTVFISVFGADLRTLSVATALLIASVKALVVGYYFMHLKYDPAIYRIMMGIVMALFTVFLVMVIFDYLTRI
ncbi:MAG: cytochrome C oxidase subunit IV family protein [Bacteroidales bacterium]|nr:cytochrome C oxidase subunit IV family protein [Bacteroidales bacterium]